jgi:hypothetical protein
VLANAFVTSRTLATWLFLCLASDGGELHDLRSQDARLTLAVTALFASLSVTSRLFEHREEAFVFPRKARPSSPPVISV